MIHITASVAVQNRWIQEMSQESEPDAHKERVNNNSHTVNRNGHITTIAQYTITQPWLWWCKMYLNKVNLIIFPCFNSSVLYMFSYNAPLSLCIDS